MPRAAASAIGAWLALTAATAGCGYNMRAWQRRSAEAIQECHARDIDIYEFERLDDRREWVAVCNGRRWSCSALDDGIGRGGEAECAPIP